MPVNKQPLVHPYDPDTFGDGAFGLGPGRARAGLLRRGPGCAAGNRGGEMSRDRIRETSGGGAK